ncbi:cytochrome P450 [Gloeopeniophorella convolvens]|nr:cytochrome P450 [Gloeopeniophorella convolvens]
MTPETGEIISLEVFGQTIVVLNSVRVCKDLFEKRGEIYSERPIIPFFEMMGWHMFVPYARYGDGWRRERKLLDRGLRASAAGRYYPMQQARVHVLLERTLAQPDDWRAHLELMQGELMLELAYGYKAHGRDDKMVEAARKMNTIGTNSAAPGQLLINNLPSLAHVPGWLPWLSYKPLARQGQRIWHEVMYAPIQHVKDNMETGTANSSLALEILQETESLAGEEKAKEEKVIAESLGSLYGSGADTSVAALTSFFLAALLHPDVQKKAQAEIDAATARERLPAFEDRSRLPYVDAICKEVQRWRPVAPLSLPHALKYDDVYEGFFIPKGAVVLANSWSMLHDEATYPDHDAFKPERFLQPDGTLRDDPVLAAAFGYGRRICPGRHFADATLFITVASLLAMFDIKPKKDEEGREVQFDVAFDGSIVR